jgi:hypothetical protein
MAVQRGVGDTHIEGGLEFINLILVPRGRAFHKEVGLKAMNKDANTISYNSIVVRGQAGGGMQV